MPGKIVPLLLLLLCRERSSFLLLLKGGNSSAYRGNIPDENLLGNDLSEDSEIYRYKQIARALRYNFLYVRLNTVVHPEGLLEGTSKLGPASKEWPAPSL